MTTRRAGRHRSGRSLMWGPLLARRHQRADYFLEIVDSTMLHLRKVGPDLLQTTAVRIHSMPPASDTSNEVPRFHTSPSDNSITLFRIPIERLGHHHPEDRWYERMVIESTVIRAAAELTGLDPWQLTPGRPLP